LVHLLVNGELRLLERLLLLHEALFYAFVPLVRTILTDVLEELIQLRHDVADAAVHLEGVDGAVGGEVVGDLHPCVPLQLLDHHRQVRGDRGGNPIDLCQVLQD